MAIQCSLVMIVGPVAGHSSTNSKVPSSIWAQSHSMFMDFNETYLMYPTPGVVQNVPNPVGLRMNKTSMLINYISLCRRAMKYSIPEWALTQQRPSVCRVLLL